MSDGWLIVGGFSCAGVLAYLALAHPAVLLGVWFGVKSALEKGLRTAFRAVFRRRISAAEPVFAPVWLVDRWALDHLFAADMHVLPGTAFWPRWPSVSQHRHRQEKPDCSLCDSRFPW